MATTDWSKLKGKNYRISVGKTSAEAVAASESENIFFTTDGNIVMNGIIFSPAPQVGMNGYEGLYIFSHQTDKNRKVLNGNFKVIINNQKNVELQHMIWGAQSYTSQSTCYVIFPNVTSSSNGMMDRYVYARVLNHTISLGTSTTEEVVINYTNFSDSGNKTFVIEKATSAKAGVMTSNQYNQLADLANYQRGDFGTFTTTTAFKEALANMPTTHKGKYGRYYARLFGIYVYITFISLESSSGSYAQWVEGPMIKSSIDNDIYLNNELGCHIIGRVYKNGAWGYWRSNILDDELPMVATTLNDGLMSKEDKALLMKVKEKLEL